MEIKHDLKRRVNVRRVRDSKEDWLQKELPVLEDFIGETVGDTWKYEIRDKGSYVEVALTPVKLTLGATGAAFWPVLTYTGGRYGALDDWCDRFESFIWAADALMDVAYVVEGGVADLGAAVDFIRDMLPEGAGSGWDDYTNYRHVVESSDGSRIQIMVENEEISEERSDVLGAYIAAAEAMNMGPTYWAALCSVTSFLVRVVDGESGEDRDVVYKQSPSWLDVRQIVRAVESLGTDFTFASAVEKLSKW